MPAASRLEQARLSTQHWALLRLGELARRLSRTRPRPANLVTGERGELEALFHLRRLGYVVVERRWRTKEFNGDLDLIAYEGDTLCFIEVKTRTRRDLTPAASAIDFSKKQMLRRMAGAYRRSIPAAERYTALYRFDVVSIYLEEGRAACELVRDAFAAQDTFARGGV